MIYDIIFSKEAQKDLAYLKKSEPKSFIKAQSLIKELRINPYAGTGKPKLLTGNLAGRWSRRISQKHRLVYTVNESIVTVSVLAAANHYNDK